MSALKRDFELPAWARRLMFEDDLWDFTDVVGLPIQMPLADRRFDFTLITNLGWRLVAKELILALLAPRHEAVAPLPRAYRTPLPLRTALLRLLELIRRFGWLSQRGIVGLTEVDNACCHAYLDHRRYLRDDDGVVVGERSPAIRRSAAQIVVELTNADAGSPKVQRNNREVPNLLTKRARTLHLGSANYCWFTGPSRALCLKLAGTPHAEKSLAGMCDSARCPQATYHRCHRPVWAEHAQQTTTFLGELGPTRKTEQARLRTDLDRGIAIRDPQGRPRTWIG